MGEPLAFLAKRSTQTVEMLARENAELRARLESTRALLRGLAAPARLAALERLIKIARLALSWGMADKDDCPNEFGADVNEAAALLDVLRRADAEAGEEKDDLCPE